MFNQRISSIDVTRLSKGQTISGDLAWDHYVTQKPEKLSTWICEYGDERSAKIAKLPQVLVQVQSWIERDRIRLELPPLVTNAKGGNINILTDEEASIHCSQQAFQGLRKHQRNTARLIKAVDESQLSSAAKREHENRIMKHSFIEVSIHGSKRQLRVLEKANKPITGFNESQS